MFLLTITIVILLILASITINTLFNNGIFEKTRLSKQQYENFQKDENLILDTLSNEIDSIVGSRDELTESEIREIVRQELTYQKFSKEILWSGVKTDTGTINLNKSVNDFDAIYIWGQYSSSNSTYGQANGLFILKEDYETPQSDNNYRFSLNGSLDTQQRRICFDFTGDIKNQLTISSIATMRLLKVYGINF